MNTINTINMINAINTMRSALRVLSNKWIFNIFLILFFIFLSLSGHSAFADSSSSASLASSDPGSGKDPWALLQLMISIGTEVWYVIKITLLISGVAGLIFIILGLLKIRSHALDSQGSGGHLKHGIMLVILGGVLFGVPTWVQLTGNSLFGSAPAPVTTQADVNCQMVNGQYAPGSCGIPCSAGTESDGANGCNPCASGSGNNAVGGNCLPCSAGQGTQSGVCQPCAYASVGGVCVSECPQATPLNSSGSCVATCPSDSPMTSGGTCVANCPSSSYNMGNNTCATSCTGGVVNDGNCYMYSYQFPSSNCQLMSAQILCQCGGALKNQGEGFQLPPYMNASTLTGYYQNSQSAQETQKGVQGCISGNT
jgi:hypothetical protein